jgi:hypothetical protein
MTTLISSKHFRYPEFLQHIPLHHSEDPQCRMSDAEVMTTAIIATLYFGGNLERARKLLGQTAHLHSPDAL